MWNQAFFRFQAKQNFRFNFKFRFNSESEGAPYWWAFVFMAKCLRLTKDDKQRQSLDILLGEPFPSPEMERAKRSKKGWFSEFAYHRVNNGQPMSSWIIRLVLLLVSKPNVFSAGSQTVSFKTQCFPTFCSPTLWKFYTFIYPLTHWFSLDIHIIGTERRAQVRPTYSLFEK